MSDDEVIKRRLLIDGDGTGDDRRLNVLIKSFLKYCNSTESTENMYAIHDRMLTQLTQCEFTVTKSEFNSKMMTEELKNYENISKSIDLSIEQAKSQIEQSKENLVLAKKIRKNRMECDVLAKIINQQPDRKETAQKLQTLKMELAELEDNKAKSQRKLEQRRNEFTVLMRSIKDLQRKLDDNMNQSSMEPDTNEEIMNVDE